MNALRNLVLISLIIHSSFVLGQNSKAEVGFEAGPGYFSLRGNEIVEEYKTTALSYSGGLSCQFNFSKLLSIRANISYERKVFAPKIILTDLQGNNIGEAAHEIFNYVTVPLLVRFTFGKEIKFFFHAGPYLGYLLSQIEKSKAQRNLPAYESDNTYMYLRQDYGFVAGLGITVPIEKRLLLTAELRNARGLPCISALPVYNDGSIKTNNTSLLLGVAYRIGVSDE